MKTARSFKHDIQKMKWKKKKKKVAKLENVWDE